MHPETSTGKFIAVPFVLVPSRIKPNAHNETRGNRLWYIRTAENEAPLTADGPQIHIKTWVNLTDMISRRRRQTPENAHHVCLTAGRGKPRGRSQQGGYSGAGIRVVTGVT